MNLSLGRVAPRRLVTFASVLFFALAALIVFDAPQVSAATGEWVDAGHIKIGSAVYIDPSLGDSMDYFAGGVDDCTNVIKGFNKDFLDPGTDYSKAKLITKTRDPRTGDCESNEESITLSSPDNASVFFHWVDQGKLEAAFTKLDGGIRGGTYSLLEGSSNEFLDDSASGCKSGVITQGSSSGSFTMRFTFSGDCQEGDPITVGIGSTQNSQKPAGSGTPANTPVAGTTAAPTCESKGGPLSWIMCSILRQIDEGISGLDNQINTLLSVPESDYADDGPLHGAWENIRNIAYIVLVPIILVMVISTALGFEFVSAYTVKRALPRLIAAVLFIALSWEITTFLITLTNNIGGGVKGLLTAPFDNVPTSLAAVLGAGEGATVLFAGVVAGTVATAVLGTALAGIVFSYALVSFVAILIGFFVLGLRQVFLLALVLVAPLAILAWIFPGNDKFWKLWWGSFSKLLIMFPLIIALITVGRIFAGITSVSQGDPIGLFIKLTAYIGPYFFIPATFKFAGGAFATLAGVAQDRERGLFDRQKKKRQEMGAEGYHKFKSGDRWQGGNALTKRINKVGEGIGVGWRGRYGVGEQGRQAVSIATGMSAEENLKNNPKLKQLAMYDEGNAVLALSGGSRAGAEQAARQLFTDANGVYDEAGANRALAAASVVGFTKGNAAASLTTMAQNKSRAVGAGRYDLVRDGINRLAGENAQEAQQLSYGFQYFSRGSGRIDLGGNWMGGGLQERAQTTAERVASREGRTVTRDDVTAAMSHEVMLDGISRTELPDLVRGYAPGQTRQIADTISYTLQNGDITQQQEAAVRLIELQNALPYASGANQEIISGMMADLNLDPAASGGLAPQLAARINPRNPEAYARELQAGARVYDQQQQRDFTAGTTGGPAPPPPSPEG